MSDSSLICDMHTSFYQICNHRIDKVTERRDLDRPPLDHDDDEVTDSDEESFVANFEETEEEGTSCRLKRNPVWSNFMTKVVEFDSLDIYVCAGRWKTIDMLGDWRHQWRERNTSLSPHCSSDN